MLAAPFIEMTKHRLQVEFHRSAVGLRMARLVFSLSRMWRGVWRYERAMEELGIRILEEG